MRGEMPHKKLKHEACNMPRKKQCLEETCLGKTELEFKEVEAKEYVFAKGDINYSGVKERRCLFSLKLEIIWT